MKYWAIWAHKPGRNRLMLWLDYVYRSRYSKPRAILYGKRLLKAWKLRGYVVEVRPFESDSVRPLGRQNLFNSD